MLRRTFLASTAASAGVLGSNDRVRLGIIGTGGRGSYLMRVAKLTPVPDGMAQANG